MRLLTRIRLECPQACQSCSSASACDTCVDNAHLTDGGARCQCDDGFEFSGSDNLCFDKLACQDEAHFASSQVNQQLDYVIGSR